MTPHDKARAWHDRQGSNWTFSEILAAHDDVGHVFINRKIVMAGRRVHHWWTDDDMSDPNATAEDGDCWHVWILAGDFTRAMAYLPFPLPFVSFHRRGKLRVMTLECARQFLTIPPWKRGKRESTMPGHGKLS